MSWKRSVAVSIPVAPQADFVRQVDEFVAWLNPKGVRELALKNTLAKWWAHIAPGMRRRTAVSGHIRFACLNLTYLWQDLTANIKAPDARRSARTKNSNSDLLREPYMAWTNRRAVSAS